MAWLWLDCGLAEALLPLTSISRAVQIIQSEQHALMILLVTIVVLLNFPMAMAHLPLLVLFFGQFSLLELFSMSYKWCVTIGNSRLRAYK